MSLTHPAVAQTLKQQTEKQHCALEDLVMPCLKDMATKQDYIQLIKAFYGFFKPVEEAVAPFVAGTFLPDWPQRRKADLILHDLKTLGEPVVPLPLASGIPAIHNLPQALGALYVMEGSTLGGRGITKMLLKSSAGLQIGHLQFFNGYGDNTGPMWTSFVNVLNSFYGTGEEVQQMIGAANETFSLFKSWLQQTLMHD